MPRERPKEIAKKTKKKNKKTSFSIVAIKHFPFYVLSLFGPLWLLLFYFLNWKIVSLLCVHFWSTAKWFISVYIYILQILLHCSLLQDIEYSSLCYSAETCYLSFSNIFFKKRFSLFYYTNKNYLQQGSVLFYTYQKFRNVIMMWDIFPSLFPAFSCPRIGCYFPNSGGHVT